MTTASATVLSLVAAFWLSSSTAFATEAGHALSGRWTLASVGAPLSDVMARAVDGHRLEIALTLRTARGVMHRTFTFQRAVFLTKSE